MMTASGDSKFVMGLMGHSDLKMTMKYLHPDSSRAATLLNDRDNERQAESENSKPIN
jgi:integrase